MDTKKTAPAGATAREYHASFKLGILALTVTIILIGGAGLFYRWDLVSLGLAFSMLRYGIYAGVATVVLCLIGGAIQVRRGAWVQAAAPLVAIWIAIMLAYVPIGMRQQAQSVPFIHDVSTDTSNPPAFVALAEQRGENENPLAYGEAIENTAQLQAEGYPDIQTRRFNAPADAVFTEALASAREMGWDIVATVPEQGRIEAVATTAWFGFKDDVVIRVTAAEGGETALDIRSQSRVGGSDLGANAKRIGEFLAVFDLAE
jgi:hypothetical protein